jgi:iron complex transport system substrate-binding protein
MFLHRPDRLRSIRFSLRALAFALALVGALSEARGVSAATSRIVSLGGSITEILYALHLDDRVAGVDSTSLYPLSALKDKPVVGYVRALSAEGVLSLKPSLVLAIEGAGPPDALNLVRQAGVRLEMIPDDPTPEGVRDKIEILGKLLDAQDAAQALNQSVAQNFARLDALRAAISKPVRVLFVLSFANGRTLVGGRGTTAAGIIKLAGAVNAAEDVEGYKPMTNESIVAAAPDVVLTMRNGDHLISSETLFASPAFSMTPAAKSNALVAVDGLLLLGFGPRTPDAARLLIKAFYPDLPSADR